MRIKTTTRLRRVLALTAALTLAMLDASHARAQAMLTFSGGNGTPLNLTLNAPVTYAITGTNSRDNLFFDLQGTGDLFTVPFHSLEASPTASTTARRSRSLAAIADSLWATSWDRI